MLTSFVNAAYVAGGLDVQVQLQECLPHDWHVTLLTVDGHRTSDVTLPCQSVPTSVRQVVVRAGDKR
jgi:hypothetical protein